jgi:nitrite reductase/ring-hydroxylating ferredoxin subunit
LNENFAPPEKGQREMANFVKVCKAEDIKAGCAKSVEVNGKSVGVYNVDGKFYAINDICGHRGGPLAEGELDGTTVICPWHGWRYNVTTGENELLPALPIEKYEVEVEEDDVLVDV